MSVQTASVQRPGARVVPADAATAAIHARRPDLVVRDLDMRDGGGIDRRQGLIRYAVERGIQ